jgi:LuxR family transcriptional regulator, maltose regulon positive regulatory protein
MDGDRLTNPGVVTGPEVPGDPEPLLRASAFVERPRLLRRLEAAAAPVVLFNAPSGYGKSVLLGQWAAHDSRPFASIILDDRHNDPAMLVASIVGSLDTVEAVGPEVSAALASPEPNLDGVVLPRLGQVLSERQLPFVLVLDDLEQLESPQSLRVVSTIGSHLGRGSQLALATRTEPAMPIGRLRAHRGLTELGRRDLVLTKAECKALLAALGLEPSPTQLDILVRHTEGWPAALYLAGLALGEEPDLAKAIAQFAGDDRIVVDYIKEEFLVPVSRRRLEFLRRVSVLDRLSGGLCDAVLGRTGSATVLRDLSRSNVLLMPLDRRDEWFRFHPMFGEMLRSELHRVEPSEEAALNRRASDWWAEHGDSDRAIHHAIEGEAVARAGELLFTGIPEYMARGRNATVLRWLDRLGEDAVASDPALSLTAAYARITLGAGAQAEHWAAVSRSLLGEMRVSEEKNALESGLALVEATLAREGVEAMSAHTAAAAELLPDESPWLSVCCLLDGVGLHLRGFRDQARERLAEGSRRGAVGAPNVQVLCLAQLSLLAIDDGDWQVAEMLASQARAQVERSGLGDYPMIALGVAVSAFVRSHIGKVEKATADLRLAIRLLGELDDFGPWYEAEARIVLARTAARLGDAPTATRMIDEAARLLRRTPDATVLGEWIDQTVAVIEDVSASAVKDLTPAELRVLQFLPTHLSFPEIAAQAFVSPNTVKTQAQAVYRKLGVSSRREAVEQARAAGLLDGDGSSAP